MTMRRGHLALLKLLPLTFALLALSISLAIGGDRAGVRARAGMGAAELGHPAGAVPAGECAADRSHDGAAG